MIRPILLLYSASAFAISSCDSAASRTDPNDLHGLFTDAGSTADAAAPRASSADAGVPKPPVRERKPPKGPCIASAGTPGPEATERKSAGRPGCRGARVLEQPDGAGAPRYACLFEPPALDKHKPLPLVLFFHAEGENPTAVHRKTRLRALYDELDLSGDPERPGFVLLAPQGRRLGAGLRFDTAHHAADNRDAVVVDRFVAELSAAGVVDERQIYAIGDSQGGVFAGLYAMLRPERIAGWGVFGAAASALRWSCEPPEPPVAVVYRACDAAVACADVESWLGLREQAGAASWSRRLGDDRSLEPSCAVKSCKPARAAANHARWPSHHERDMLEFLGGFRLAVR